MTISGSDLAAGARDYATGSRLLAGLTTNPFLAALMITLILVATVFVVFRRCQLPAGETLTSLSVRVGVYAFVGVCGVMWLHNMFLRQQLAAVGGLTAPSISDNLLIAPVAPRPDNVVGRGDDDDDADAKEMPALSSFFE